MSDAIRARIIEHDLWAVWEAEQKADIFGRRFAFACGVMMAIILAANAWLVYIIWFSR